MITYEAFDNEISWLEKRLDCINSSEVADLYGCGHNTKYKLYFIKKHRIIEEKNKEYIYIGKKIEQFIASIFEDKMGIKLKKKNEYIQDMSIKLGASFDFQSECGNVIVETKNVSDFVFAKEWDTSNSEIKIPKNFFLQLQTQMIFTGHEYCYIAALVGGNRFITQKIFADKEVQKDIKEQAIAFWNKIEHEDYQPNIEEDFKFINEWYLKKSKNTLNTLVANDEQLQLIKKYQEAKEAEKQLHTHKEMLRARVARILGDYSSITDSFNKTIATKQEIRHKNGSYFKINITGDFI